MRKRIRKSLWFLPVWFLFVSDCAHAPKVYTFENDYSIDFGYEKVWDAVIEALAVRNIPIDTLDKASGFICTKRTNFQNSYADCGSSPFDDRKTGERFGSFKIVVRELSAIKCSLKITANYNSAPKNIKCNSTGEMEQWFYETLNHKLVHP